MRDGDGRALWVLHRGRPRDRLMQVPYLATVLAAGVVVFAIVAWWRGWWTLIGWLHCALIAATGVARIWWHAYWNVMF